MSIRICHILNRPLRIATATMEFIKAEAAAGLSVSVICPAQPDDPPQWDFHGAQVTTVAAAMVRRFAPLESARLLGEILGAMGNQPFDVILVYGFRGCSVLPLLRRDRARVWLLNIRNSNLRIGGWRAALSDRLTSLETRAFDATIFCDPGVGSRLLGKRPFHVVPNGANLARLAAGARQATRERLGIAPDERVLIYSGTLTAIRRPQRMLETFALVDRPAARLLVVGTGEELPALRRWTVEHGWAQKVIFTDQVPYAEIQDYLAAADIALAYYPDLPTFDRNLPLKTSEFLAAGLPTVATNTYGNRFYITHGQNGLLAADDPPALAQAITRLLDDPALASQLAAAAPDSVRAYDWGTLVHEHLLPIYQRYIAP